MNNKGFTLIELIVVIVLLSIVSATVLPKFLSSKGFEEYTYRDELIIKLRAIQLRTMQQIQGSTCQTIQVTPTEIGLLATEIGATCSTDYTGKSTTITVEHPDVSFTVSEGLSSFSFSQLGRPVGCIAQNPCMITLTISGESELAIEINSEGYIHAI